MPLLEYIFVKRNVRKMGMVFVHFLLQPQGGTGEFMYKASILGNKELLSNMYDRQAT